MAYSGKWAQIKKSALKMSFIKDNNQFKIHKGSSFQALTTSFMSLRCNFTVPTQSHRQVGKGIDGDRVKIDGRTDRPIS